MSNTIEDEAVDIRYLVSSLSGWSESSPTNAASSVKDAKKKNATHAPKNIRV